MEHRSDFLVIGSGIAGLTYALKAAEHGKVIVICKYNIEESNTYYAQGGIAAVIYKPDTYEKHIKDTIECGAGLNNENIVRMVVTESSDRVKELIAWGANFDKTPNGDYDLAREGGHSEYRVLHHKDNTGAEILRALISQIRAHSNIKVLEHYFAIDLITQHQLGKEVQLGDTDIDCYGVYALNLKNSQIETILAKKTLLASGGIGNLYHVTTNPLIATGDGIAMVNRAKGLVERLEFVQFHPTALHIPGERPTFLITEALRGFGAILKNKDGKEFMNKYDARGSLAPRDIVAQAIDNEMKISGNYFVYLDSTHLNAEKLKYRFPNIYKECKKYGIDITKEMIPVVPAAHYLVGGIKVDEWGRTSINNLYAAGEVASTGMHGANRLASNSLLEALVFADRAAKHTIQTFRYISMKTRIPAWNDEGTTHTEEMILITQNQREVQQIMSNYVGIVRSNLRLQRALTRLEIIYRETEDLYKKSKLSLRLCELRNMINVAYLIIKMAQKRHESIGLHYNIDYPSS